MAICGKESPRLTRAVSAYRKEDFKYIHLFDDDSDELYNLRDDESETTNLIDQLPDRRQEHHRLLKNWVTEVRVIVPEGQKAMSHLSG